MLVLYCRGGDKFSAPIGIYTDEVIDETYKIVDCLGYVKQYDRLPLEISNYRWVDTLDDNKDNVNEGNLIGGVAIVEGTRLRILDNKMIESISRL